MEFGEYVYCIKDNRTGKYRQNLFVSLLDPEHFAKSWLESYLSVDEDKHEPYCDVYLIGQFDHDTGFLKALEPSQVVCGLDCEHLFCKMKAGWLPQLAKAREVA